MNKSRKSVAVEIQNMVLRHRALSVEQISELTFGSAKSHWTLYKELNPEDSTAKMGVLDLVPLMKTCGSPAPLEAIAHQMNMVVIPLPEARVCTGHLENDMNRTTKEFGDAVVKFSAIMEDGEIKPEEFAEFDKEIMELVSTALYWRDGIKAMVKG
ncbi:phage regulatory CII family protein [Maridesulfovibrio frigidus]|uniref:phage regulatory CII family protein n=1 Tax=Maridesulfovibrio frigidus TaxID=340956 RepID=UPI0004E0E760|nr:phage regulatory CII family protein [Maridesulfovibrio frigidus]